MNTRILNLSMIKPNERTAVYGHKGLPNSEPLGQAVLAPCRPPLLVGSGGGRSSRWASREGGRKKGQPSRSSWPALLGAPALGGVGEEGGDTGRRSHRERDVRGPGGSFPFIVTFLLGPGTL